MEPEVSLKKIEGKSLLLKGCRPICFANREITGKGTDIGIDSEGVVSRIGENLNPGEWDASVDLSETYLCPGWVDLHTHVFQIGRYGMDPERAGPRYGVTTLVDAGSAGEATFRGFREYVIDRKEYPILAFLNLGSFGITGVHQPEMINHLQSMQCVEKNRDVIRGIKILASKRYIAGGWIYPIVAAKRLAVDMDLPLMVHIGEPPVYLEELIGGILDSGDIITHCFNGKVGNSVRSSPSRVISLYRKAIDRGIILDIGHGVASFSVESARSAIQQGIKPHTISTDIHLMNVDGPVWSLCTVMSKMLACGLELEEVVEMVTINPRAVLRETEYGVLKEGVVANFTAFDVVKGEFTFTDAGAIDEGARLPDVSLQTPFPGTRFVRPRYVCYNGIFSETEARGLRETQNPAT